MTNDGSSNRLAFLSSFASRRPIPGEHRLLLFIIACIIFTAGRAPFIGQWDSFDYLKQTVTHRLSDLGFGRPVFIGFNILLWEILKKIFRLAPLQVEGVLMGEIILVGAVGIVVFAKLVRQLLAPSAGRLALLALLLSPMYALYSGFIMTEIPMLVTLVAAAVILWPSDSRHRILRDVAAGGMLGLAVGIREQAITMGAAYLWIIWCRRAGLSARLRSVIAFGGAAALVITAPIAALYLYDSAAFMERTRVWWHTIPTGQSHLWKNLQASLLWTLAACPAAWLAMLGAWIYHLARGRRREESAGGTPGSPAVREGRGMIPAPIIGSICCLVLPVAALWRDADVQMHPRYAIIVLPAAIVLCATLYTRWAPSPRAAVAWAAIHLTVFGIAQVGLQPLRQVQLEKREYARLVRKSVPGEALLIPGGYSPIMDYYRAVGDRPQWRILWSGWGWQGRTAEAVIQDAWSRHIPVYLCQGPAGWLYLEDELLDLYFVFRQSIKVEVAPSLYRVYRD